MTPYAREAAAVGPAGFGREVGGGRGREVNAILVDEGYVLARPPAPS